MGIAEIINLETEAYFQEIMGKRKEEDEKITPVSNEEVSLTEVREITHNGQIVGNPEIRTQRPGGTYSTAVPLRLPQNARRGEYKVRYIVESRNANDTIVEYFGVE